MVAVRDRGHDIPLRRPAIFNPFDSTKPSGLAMEPSQTAAGSLRIMAAASRNYDDDDATFSFALPIPTSAAE